MFTSTLGEPRNHWKGTLINNKGEVLWDPTNTLFLIRLLPTGSIIPSLGDFLTLILSIFSSCHSMIRKKPFPSHSFIHLYQQGFIGCCFTRWCIIHYYHLLFWFSDCPWYGQWEPLQVSSCVLWKSPHCLERFLTFCINNMHNTWPYVYKYLYVSTYQYVYMSTRKIDLRGPRGNAGGPYWSPCVGSCQGCRSRREQIWDLLSIFVYKSPQSKFAATVLSNSIIINHL